MKRILLAISLVVFFGLLYSCGGSGVNAMADNPVEDSVAITKSLTEPALLRSLFPAPPQGFQYKDEYIAMDTATGEKMTNVIVVYEDESAAQVYLSVQDCLYAREFFTLATGLWNPEMTFDKEGSFARAIDLPEGQTGWESFDAKANQGTMILGINDRYLVSIRTEKMQGTDKIRNWVTAAWLANLP